MQSMIAIINGQIDNIFKTKIVSGGMLRAANKTLVIIGLILAGYLMAEIIFIKPQKNVTTLSGVTVRAGDAAVTNARRSAVRDYASYAQELSGKNIFIAGGGQSIGASVSSEDASFPLLLSGIIRGEAPQAIIEDKIEQKTYYLKEGESIGAYTIEDISDGMVLLDSGGRKTRLVL